MLQPLSTRALGRTGKSPVRRPRHSDLLAVLVALVLTLGLAGCGGSLSDEEMKDVVDRVGAGIEGGFSAPRPFDQPLAVGATVATKDKADVTLQAISRDAQGWPAPATGLSVIVLDVTLVNRGAAPLALEPQKQFDLVDQANNTYLPTALKGFDPLDGGKRTLAPGASARGQVAFAVPADVKYLGLEWTAIAPTILAIQDFQPK